MKTLLHITPHLGGGVGRVLGGSLEALLSDAGRSFDPEVISLEHANEDARCLASRIGLRLRDRMAAHPEAILDAITKADVVLIHFWNHPLLYALLVRHALPPARIIFWSHISGFFPPYVFAPAALNYPDRFVLTTPISREVPEVVAYERATGQPLPVIWSTGGTEHVERVTPLPHSRFTIGYIGTVDYAKMHPRFVDLSSRVDIPDAEWVVCGGPNERVVAEEARARRCLERFRFEGPVKDIKSYLARFDVFGYPLSPEHYGTCEQALIEAMAAGVPPVVLANRTEQTIVEDGKSGLVATSEDDYVRAIERLARDPELRQRLSDGARVAAKHRFSLAKMVTAWDAMLLEVLDQSKRSRVWRGTANGPQVTGAQLFVESLGLHHSQPFRATTAVVTDEQRRAAESQLVERYGVSHAFRSRTRGTPHHYRTFFPEDSQLQRWSALLTPSEA